eukprot:1507224-Rhodomonas_salina.1
MTTSVRIRRRIAHATECTVGGSRSANFPSSCLSAGEEKRDRRCVRTGDGRADAQGHRTCIFMVISSSSPHARVPSCQRCRLDSG